MNDLISRQAAIDALNKKRIETMKKGQDVNLIWECLDVVAQVPSAEPETATWIPELDRRNHWHCSKCGYVIGIMKMDAKYCLNCGAKMNLEGQGHD